MLHARSRLFSGLGTAKQFLVASLLAAVLPGVVTLASGAPLSAQGPMVLMGIDGEDGNGTSGSGHGGKAPYLAVMNYILSHVTNAGTGGILVIGGGKANDHVTQFWNHIGANATPAQSVTHVNGASAIASQSFAGFAVIAVASHKDETPSGGLTAAEQTALNGRACDIATHVNGGGGLMGLATESYCYLSKFGAVTATDINYSNTTQTAEGSEVGVPAFNTSLWHQTYATFPCMFRKLVLRYGTCDAAVIGTVYSKIKGKVFYDTDEDGAFDCGEKLLKFWTVEVRKDGETTLLDGDSTDEFGKYCFTVYRGCTYEIKVVAPNFSSIVAGTGTVESDKGFIGEETGARWLATTPQMDTRTPCTPCVAGPDFGVIWFVPANTKAGDNEVYSKGFWHSKNGEKILATKDDPCTVSPTWRDLLTTIKNPWPVGSRPTAPASYVFEDPCFKNKADACLAADCVTGFLRKNDGCKFMPPAHPASFDDAFKKFSRWIVDKDLGNAGFKLSREMAAAILNVKVGNLSDRTVYINTDPSSGVANLVSFDELTYKAICLLLTPEFDIHASGPNATGDWRTLRDAILMDLQGTDPYPLPLDLGRETATDSILHPFLRRPQPQVGALRGMIPRLTKQFSQINTGAEPTGDGAYVWEPEPEPNEDGAIPVPAEPYGTGIG